MTITAKTTRVQYTGTGTTGPFPYGWKILDEADLAVIRTTDAGVDTTLALTTDYSVTGVGSDSGGNVTLVSSLPSGYKLTIYMEMDIAQPTDLTNQQSPFLERIEDALDRQALISQQLQTQIDLCVQLPPSTDEDPAEIVNIVTQKAAEAAASSASALSAQTAAETARDEAVAAAENVSVLKYTGTASAGQTVVTPGFTWNDAAGNIVVYVDGLKQATNTYTLTSPTLTLSEALVGGETIEVYSIDFTAAPGSPLYAGNNLSDLGNAATARTNLGLGDSSTKNVGTAAGTVAAGNDSRITGAIQSTALDTDGTLAANSDSKIATQKAVKTYVDGKPAGGMWAYVSKGTASNSATLDFTSLDYTTYDYKFVLRDLIPGTTSNALQMLTGYGATPTYNVVDYSYGVLGYDHLGAGAHLNGNDTTNIALTNNMTTSEKVFGEIVTTHANDGFKANFKLDKAYASTSPTITTFTGSGVSYTNPVTGVRFKYGSGNIASGTVEMWRRTKQ